MERKFDAVLYSAAIPMTFFVDQDGNLATYAQRAIDGDLLQTGIDMILP